MQEMSLTGYVELLAIHIVLNIMKIRDPESIEVEKFSKNLDHLKTHDSILRGDHHQFS